MGICFAIDPGNIHSAYCSIDTISLKPLAFGKITNAELYLLIKDSIFVEDDSAVIEMIASYGMSVGKEVFDTCFWIGRYYETLSRKLYNPPQLLYRKEEKLHICGSMKAKDTNIRQALIDRFAKHDLKNGKGTASNKDWFYGFKADFWAAYSVAITYIETRLNNEQKT